MTRLGTPSFGIMTEPAHVGYDEIRRVWREADGIPEIEHAWLYDHLLPRTGDPAGPAYEGWTLLTALAAQTRRLRCGLLVTNNRIRHPAVLAKIAATLDVISGGRLDFGIGVGGLPPAATHGTNVATEFPAYGVPFGPWSDAVAGFAEACALIRRMWNEEDFDFDGSHYQLNGVRCNPKPVQHPHPPILIGGLGTATLRIVAGHADIWNALGPPVNTVERLSQRSAVLDQQCWAIGRDPGLIVRSAHLTVSYNDPAPTREALGFVPDVVTAAPPVAVARLARQLQVEPGELDGYGEREQTRTDHLRLVLRYSGWQTARMLELKELEEFLLARGMEHDAPSLLFRPACEHLRSSKVVRPGVVTLLERVAAGRAAAQRETYAVVCWRTSSTVQPAPTIRPARLRRGRPLPRGDRSLVCPVDETREILSPPKRSSARSDSSTRYRRSPACNDHRRPARRGRASHRATRRSSSRSVRSEIRAFAMSRTRSHPA